MNISKNISNYFGRASRIALVFVLCLVMLPASAFATEDTTTSTQSPAPATQEKQSRKAKSFKWNGFNLKFKSANVLIDDPLPNEASPYRETAPYKGKKRTVKWTKARNSSLIDGYIILRRTGTSSKASFTEVARVSKTKASYKDKVPKSRKRYFYIIVGYKKVGSDYKISACSGSLIKPPKRKYQNPKGYVQISDRISTHGYNYYTAPVLVNSKSSRKDHVEAMIKTAYKYKGNRFSNRWSRRPGPGVDCSGLVMQACYGAGVDLWPSNPYRHRYGAARYEWESRELARSKKLKTVSYKNRQRGDLLFYANSSGTVIHVAIYLGGNRMIHSYLPGVKVTGTRYPGGHICKVKRVFVN